MNYPPQYQPKQQPGSPPFMNPASPMQQPQQRPNTFAPGTSYTQQFNPGFGQPLQPYDHSGTQTYDQRIRQGFYNQPDPTGMDPYKYGFRPQQTPMTGMKQAPAQQQPMQQPGGPTQPNPISDLIARMTSPAPLDAAAAQGHQYIDNAIPTNANALFGSSPAFNNVGPGLRSAIEGVYPQRGGGDRQREHLGLTRQIGLEGPQFQLQQLGTLRGLENQELGLGNRAYGVEMDAMLGQILPLLQLMGGLV